MDPQSKDPSYKENRTPEFYRNSHLEFPGTGRVMSYTLKEPRLRGSRLPSPITDCFGLLAPLVQAPFQGFSYCAPVIWLLHGPQHVRMKYHIQERGP